MQARAHSVLREGAIQREEEPNERRRREPQGGSGGTLHREIWKMKLSETAFRAFWRQYEIKTGQAAKSELKIVDITHLNFCWRNKKVDLDSLWGRGVRAYPSYPPLLRAWHVTPIFEVKYVFWRKRIFMSNEKCLLSAVGQVGCPHFINVACMYEVSYDLNLLIS